MKNCDDRLDPASSWNWSSYGRYRNGRVGCGTRGQPWSWMKKSREVKLQRKSIAQIFSISWHCAHPTPTVMLLSIALIIFTSNVVAACIGKCTVILLLSFRKHNLYTILTLFLNSFYYYYLLPWLCQMHRTINVQFGQDSSLHRLGSIVDFRAMWRTPHPCSIINFLRTVRKPNSLTTNNTAFPLLTHTLPLKQNRASSISNRKVFTSLNQPIIFRAVPLSVVSVLFRPLFFKRIHTKALT